MAKSALHYANTKAYFRGSFVPFKEANLSIASSSVLYGLSVYTVFSSNWNEKQQKLHVFRLKDHYQRLVNSAKILDFHGFVDNWTYEDFEAVMLKLLRDNQVKEDVLIRVTIFIDELLAGTKIHGLKNSISAYIYPMGEILPLSGINVCVSSWQRTPDNAIPSRAKVNGSYINASLMKNEALLNGYDEAIALDHLGHVAEGTVANLFIVRSGKLITPDIGTDILEGITRDSVLKMASNEKIEVIQRSIDRSELYVADEIFMCGSSARLTPVLSVDRRTIGNGKIGPVTKALSKKYQAMQKGDSKDFDSWLTEV